jgi:hypothetical protein
MVLLLEYIPYIHTYVHLQHCALAYLVNKLQVHENFLHFFPSTIFLVELFPTVKHRCNTCLPVSNMAVRPYFTINQANQSKWSGVECFVYSMRPPVVHLRGAGGRWGGGGEGGMDSGITAVLSAGTLEQSMGARNRIGIGLSYRPARLYSRRAGYIGYIGWRNRFLETRDRFLGIYSWAP